MKPIDISIVVPAYNESGSIQKVITNISQVIKKLKPTFEIIVVDDGSSDGTSAVVSKLPVRLISHPYNKGYGASLKTGAKNAKGEYVLYIDGDGQHIAADIERFTENLGRYDMIVGERAKQANASRGIYKFFLHKFASYLAERNIPDLNSGFRLIKRSIVLEYLHILPEAFSFTTTITLAAIKAGYNVTYVPIRIRNRTAGVSHIKPLRDGFRFIMLLLRMTMLFSPQRVFLPTSIVLFLAGFPLLLSRIILYQRTSETALLLILSSLFIFLIGLVADQISILIRKAR